MIILVVMGGGSVAYLVVAVVVRMLVPMEAIVLFCVYMCPEFIYSILARVS